MQELENSWRISPSDVILQERIGVGTFGVVYAGLWRDLRVAIKASTHQIVWNSITHEISQIRTIRHPNIVLFFGAGNFENGMLPQSIWLHTDWSNLLIMISLISALAVSDHPADPQAHHSSCWS